VTASNGRLNLQIDWPKRLPPFAHPELAASILTGRPLLGVKAARKFVDPLVLLVLLVGSARFFFDTRTRRASRHQ
jgi:hypothetical protein